MVKRILAAALLATAPAWAAPQSVDEVVKAAPKSDWQALDPADTLYMDVPGGRVIIALAPGFAPKTVANIRKLAHDHYFDGKGAVIRVQDNYVVQWSRDPEPESGSKGWAEFDRAAAPSFKPLPDADGYAPKAGFDNGFPVAGDGKREWLTHCYGTVGVGRNMKADSGDGSELYAVIGPARPLDRNITVVGRVVQGMELLSSLPRGTETMGFYGKGQKHAAVTAFHLASDLPAAQRTPLERIRTDSASFATIVELRRNPANAFFIRKARHTDVCNIPVPVRSLKP